MARFFKNSKWLNSYSTCMVFLISDPEDQQDLLAILGIAGMVGKECVSRADFF